MSIVKWIGLFEEDVDPILHVRSLSQLQLSADSYVHSYDIQQPFCEDIVILDVFGLHFSKKDSAGEYEGRDLECAQEKRRVEAQTVWLGMYSESKV